MNAKWYEKSFRRNLVDMHIDDWDERFLSEFDPQAYLECLKEAKVQSAMIYLQSHVGLCNWDTKSGRTHRAFVGNNKVKKLIDLCHREGIDVIAYYSIIYNNQAYEDHPEWRIVKQNGKSSRGEGDAEGRYGNVCPNNQEYRAFLKEQFREISETYDYEGIYLDMTFWPFSAQICFCPSCRERYRKETGCEIPTTVDWKSPEWLRFQQARQDWMGEFAMFCTKELKKLKPEATVLHQCSGITNGWWQGTDETIAEASDYVGCDLYGGHLQESFICKMFRELSKNQPFEYQTSRCEPNLGVHTINKTTDSLRLHTYITMAHHGAMLFIDAIDPVGTLNPAVYRRIGQVFGEMEPYEKYMTGDLCSEAALLMNLDAKYDALAEPRELNQASGWNPQMDGQLGIARVLKEMRMPCTVLTGNHVERIEGKKIVFISETAKFRDEQLETIVRWVEKGGSIYLSGSADPRLAEKLLGIHVYGATEESQTYLAPTEAGKEIFGEEYSEKYPLSYDRRQVLAENPENHTVLAKVSLPYTFSGYSGKFASIHSNPPGEITEYPAMISGTYGKGRVLWSSASVERNHSDSVRQMMMRIVRYLSKPEMIKSDAPSCVEFTLFRDEERKVYYLHAVNIQDHLPAVPVADYEVRLKVNEKITEIRHLPDEEECSFDVEKDGIVLKAKKLQMFDSWVLCYEK